MEYGTQADPEPYSLVGYDFGGWYTDVALTNPYTPGPITGDMTLYAKMTPCSYTITFDSKSGSTVEPITQDYETEVTAPAAPTRKGYTFAGWYADEELREAYSFGTMPAQDITLYAKWDINQYAVTFDFGNGTVSSVVLDFDATVEYPEDIAENMGFTSLC